MFFIFFPCLKLGWYKLKTTFLGWIETYHRLPQRTWRWGSKLGLPELLEVGPFSPVEFQSFDRALPEVSLKIDVFFGQSINGLGVVPAAGGNFPIAAGGIR